MPNERDTQSDDLETVELDDDYDSLDDASRRKLLARLSGIGAAAAPTSILFLDAKKARAQNTGSSCEINCD